VNAGQGEGRLQQQDLDLKYAQLNLQAQHEANQVAAQNRAFNLQEAAGTRTPVADHIAERAALAGVQDTKIQKQLDSMFAAGSMDQGSYQRAKLALMTGNKELITDLLKPPAATKPEHAFISGTQEMETIREIFRERRRPLDSEEHLLQTKLADPTTAMSYPKGAAGMMARMVEIRRQRATEFANEEAAIATLRQQGLQPKTPTAQGSGAIITPDGAATGSGSGTVSFSPTMTDSERNIMAWARAEAERIESGSSSRIKGPDQPVVSTLAPTPAQQPPAQYPDASWNDELKAWTVIRNGQLYKVKQ
jgi:hypothetical protein